MMPPPARARGEVPVESRPAWLAGVMRQELWGRAAGVVKACGRGNSLTPETTTSTVRKVSPQENGGWARILERGFCEVLEI